MITRKSPLRVILLLTLFSMAMGAAEWPTYRQDGQRSGVTEARLPADLAPRWRFEPAHAPKPAWPMPGEETPRMHSDRAFHTVVAENTVFFGSSVDDQLYALDADSGDIRWRFFAGGPIRFAPTHDQGRLYFGSDDGWVYCLRAGDGVLLWKYRPGPDGEKVIGNGRMISLWPIRTGVLVQQGVLYLTAGVFPYEGIAIVALDAESGEEIWKNDTAGDLSWGLDYGGMAPQGYLLASSSTLYVPSGRAMPAAFNRGTGEFLRFLGGGKTGGTWALVEDGQLVAGVNNQGSPTKVAYDESGKRQGDIFASFPGVDLVLTRAVSYSLTEQGIYAIDRERYRAAAERTPKIREEQKELAKSIAALREEFKASNASVQALAARDGESSAAVLAARAESKRIQSELDAMTERTANLAEEEDTLNARRVRWFYPEPKLTTLIATQNALVTGGPNRVVTLDPLTGFPMDELEVSGDVLGMAAAGGRLFVSTDRGPIYCFDDADHPATANGGRVVRPKRDEVPYRQRSVQVRESVAAMLGEVNRKKGYCLVLNAGSGSLAYDLARNSEFQIVGLEHDPVLLDQARAKLADAGVYGSRVVIEPWELDDLPEYFANLIVVDASVDRAVRSAGGSETGAGMAAFPAAEVFRVLQPYGGALVVRGGSMASLTSWWEPMLEFGAGQFEALPASTAWSRAVRGDLQGAGSWTGLYGNAGNTGSSPDELVRGPMGVLWFGEPGSENMLDRHARSVSPLAVNGRLFIQGEEIVMGYDGYNGTELWRRMIPGAVRARVDVDGSNITATENSMFVAANAEVLRLDAETGRTVQRFRIPPQDDGRIRRWGYIAVVDGVLFGTGSNPLENEYGHLWNKLVHDGAWIPESEVPESLKDAFRKITGTFPVPDKKAMDDFKRRGLDWHGMARYPGWLPDHKPTEVVDTVMTGDLLFAYDVETGRLLWQHRGPNMPHITFSVGEGKIFFLQDDVDADEKRTAAADRLLAIDDEVYEPHREEDLPDEKRDMRRIMALDGRTGEVVWSKPMDLSGCGGTKLGSTVHSGRILFFGHYSNHDQSVFAEGGLEWRRITVLNASTGDWVWSKPLNYRRRPLVVGDTIYIEPRACSLSTGVIKQRSHPVTGESVPWEFLRPGHSCGIVTASPHSIFYRSFCAAIVNVKDDSGLQLFGGMRPGCWNNLIPANGVLNFQESSAGCTCSYPIRSTVVLNHKRRKGPGEWGVFITSGAMTPVRHFAVNLGAPGDLRDEDGTLWLAYPRPSTSVGQGPFKNYGLKFDLQESVLAGAGMGPVRRDFRGVQIEGTNRPWLFTSGVVGLTRLQVKLTEDRKPDDYTVRIGFLAPKGFPAGKRVFDVKLQGKPVLELFDPATGVNANPDLDRAVTREFSGIRVEGDLVVEFTPADGVGAANSASGPDPAPDMAPAIQFIEIVREDEVTGSAPKRVVSLD